MLVGSVLTTLIFSCQPRDIELGGGTAGNFSRDGKNGSANNAQTMTDKEISNLAVVSVERTTEVLHLVKAFLNPQYAKKNSLLKSPNEIEPTSKELPEMSLQTVIAKPIKNKKMDSPTTAAADEVIELVPGYVKKGDNELQLSYKVVDLSFDLSGRLNRLTLIKNNFSRSYSKNLNSQKADFRAVTAMEYISIRRGTEENTYTVKIERNDETDSKADRRSIISSQISFKFSWDGQISSLEQELLIANIDMKIKRTSDSGGKSGDMNLTSTQSSLAVLLQDCVSIRGELLANLNAKPFNLVFSDSTAQIAAANYISSPQACEVRPVVDFSRMLNQ